MKIRARVKAHTAKVTALAFAPDGKTLVSGGEDASLAWVDVAKKKVVARTPLGEFDPHPLSLVALRDGSGRLRGYAIWHELHYSKYVSCAVLRDLFVVHDDQEALRTLLLLLVGHWRKQGMSWANMEVASGQLTPLFALLGYERVPSIGNRYHVYSRQALKQEILDGWLRSGLDGDYFDTRPPKSDATPGHET